MISMSRVNLVSLSRQTKPCTQANIQKKIRLQSICAQTKSNRNISAQETTKSRFKTKIGTACLAWPTGNTMEATIKKVIKVMKSMSVRVVAISKTPQLTTVVGCVNACHHKLGEVAGLQPVKLGTALKSAFAKLSSAMKYIGHGVPSSMTPLF
mmetsp:Transcript_148510/g.273995  ORF Transcript_148510/g.273995 Transcript_148510/m.273995 type:complete len:153 (+) Transcript_148510:238-696(+)